MATVLATIDSVCFTSCPVGSSVSWWEVPSADSRHAQGMDVPPYCHRRRSWLSTWDSIPSPAVANGPARLNTGICWACSLRL